MTNACYCSHSLLIFGQRMIPHTGYRPYLQANRDLHVFKTRTVFMTTPSVWGPPSISSIWHKMLEPPALIRDQAASVWEFTVCVAHMQVCHWSSDVIAIISVVAVAVIVVYKVLISANSCSDVNNRELSLKSPVIKITIIGVIFSC